VGLLEKRAIRVVEDHPGADHPGTQYTGLLGSAHESQCRAGYYEIPVLKKGGPDAEYRRTKRAKEE
jgi:hypothetical protein